MAFNLVEKGRQFAFHHRVADSRGAILGQPVQRNGGWQQPRIAGHHGHEIGGLAFSGKAGVIVMHCPHLQPGGARSGKIAGEFHIVAVRTAAGFQIDEIRAHRPQRCEIGDAILNPDFDALYREFAARRGPVNQVPPACASSENYRQQQSRRPAPARGKGACSAHRLSDPPRRAGHPRLQPLMCNTQISVNSRRAVGKSVSTLPSSRSSSKLAASSCTARRAMSIVSISAAVALRIA